MGVALQVSWKGHVLLHSIISRSWETGFCFLTSAAVLLKRTQRIIWRCCHSVPPASRRAVYFYRTYDYNGWISKTCFVRLIMFCNKPSHVGKNGMLKRYTIIPCTCLPKLRISSFRCYYYIYLLHESLAKSMLNSTGLVRLQNCIILILYS
jgi:hypothetical protein